MKANELMVGDYVTFSDMEDGTFVKIKIANISKNGDLAVCIDGEVTVDGEEILDVIGIEDVVGILLTPEILERNGWHFDEICSEWYIEKGPNLFGACPKLCIFDGVSVSFVHELQHALRLCGTEKEIEL